MSRWALALLVFCAAFLAIFPVGVCSCWLMVDVARNHPHPDGQADHAHSHGYLLDLFLANMAIITLPTIISIWALIASILATALWQRFLSSSLSLCGYGLIPELPPPRV